MHRNSYSFRDRRNSSVVVNVVPPASVTLDISEELGTLAEELTQVAEMCPAWQILTWRAEQLSHMSFKAQEWAAARDTAMGSGDIALIYDDDTDALSDIDASIIVGTPSKTPISTPISTPVQTPRADARLQSHSLARVYMKALGIYELHKKCELVNARMLLICIAPLVTAWSRLVC